MMLRILTLILILSCLPAQSYSQNFWEQIQSPTDNFLRTLHFADSSRGWVGGDSGSIFFTSDGGLNWIQQQTNTSSKIMRLFFLDDQRAWALAWADAGSGDNAFYGTEFLTTTDGGENWNVEQYREENVFLRGIYFLDTLKGFVGGVPGIFLSTTDGGESWEPANIDSGTFSHFPVIDFKFYDPQYGFACGGRFDIAGVIWRTINGGESWAPLDAQYSPADEVWDIHFFDSLNVMGIGGDPDQYGVGMLNSTDAGISWGYREIGVFGQALAVSFRTANEGWAVVPQSESFVATFDYSANWVTYLTPDSSKLYDIVFTDSLTGYAVGEEGVIVKFAYRPIISNVRRNSAQVGYSDPVSVIAEINDLDGTILEAKLFYRINLGNYNELNMVNLGNDFWQTIIPPQSDSTLIDFFIRAVDNNAYVSLSPKDTLEQRYFYLVLDRPLNIQDIQFCPFGGGNSGYEYYDVTVRGIVTADTSDLEGNETGILTGAEVFIQNGQGHWSGIRIVGEAVNSVSRGDDVTVTGTVKENNSVTEISNVNSPTQIIFHSTNNPLPNPEILHTDEINLRKNGNVTAERWEGVLIKYENLKVIDENADGNIGPHDSTNNNFGEMLVADADTLSSYTRIALQYGTHDYHNFWKSGQDTIPIYIKEGDSLTSVTGILGYGSNQYKLIPRNNDDIDAILSVENQLSQWFSYSLSQNFPNPFNSSTKIEYYLPIEGNVSLEIFNVLGENVMTLLKNEYKPLGTHYLEIDAKYLPSGVYLYRIQVNEFSKVRKMILLK